MEKEMEVLTAIAEPTFAEDGRRTGDLLSFRRAFWPEDITYEVFVPLDLEEKVLELDKVKIWN